LPSPIEASTAGTRQRHARRSAISAPVIRSLQRGDHLDELVGVPSDIERDADPRSSSPASPSARQLPSLRAHALADFAPAARICRRSGHASGTGSFLGPVIGSEKYRGVRHVQHSSDFPDTGDSDDARGPPW
jgi:hypothetical protein